MCRTKRLIPADIIVKENTFNFQGNQGKVYFWPAVGPGEINTPPSVKLR